MKNFCDMNVNEIPGELSLKNFISSHVKKIHSFKEKLKI